MTDTKGLRAELQEEARALAGEGIGDDIANLFTRAASAIERLEAERDEARFLLDEGGQAYRAISDLEKQLEKERFLNMELRQFSIDYAVERDKAILLAEALRAFIPDEGPAEAEMSDSAIGSVNITLGMVRRARTALASLEKPK